MGGTTPKFGYPYPTGTDRVADGDNAIQALAEKIEANDAPGWQWMSLVSGWGPAGPGPRFRKVGDRVELRGAAFVGASGSSGANWIWGVPPGYRPVEDTNVGAIAWAPNNVVKAQRLGISVSGDNAFYLTCEYDATPVPASGVVTFEGICWYTTAT